VKPTIRCLDHNILAPGCGISRVCSVALAQSIKLRAWSGRTKIPEMNLTEWSGAIAQVCVVSVNIGERLDMQY
jgi:hypothetical protein